MLTDFSSKADDTPVARAVPVAVAAPVVPPAETVPEPATRHDSYEGACIVSIFVFALGAYLAAATILVSSIVFPIQALIVGADNLGGPGCQAVIPHYLLVFGSFTLFTVLALICTFDWHEAKFGACVQCGMSVLSAFDIAWCIYGLVLLGTQSAVLRECNSSLFDVFRIIVIWSAIAWGVVAAGMVYLEYFEG